MDTIPTAEMTSKRSSRAYVDEASHPSENQHKASNTPFRSRRNSRCSSIDDRMQPVMDTEDEHWTGVSIREAISIARSESTTAGGREFSTSASLRSVESSASSLSSSLSSSSDSYLQHPPAPPNGRPLNFGVVVPGLYRSSYPKAHDFEYIKGLQLKTMVTLVKKDEEDLELKSFLSREGIRHVVFNMKGTKKETIPVSQMKAILGIVLDKENYPLMMHCNHGKHRTGCVVGVVRKVSGWDTSNVLAEYKSYAEPKARECDLEYISNFQVSLLRNPTDSQTRSSPVQVRSFFRALMFTTLVLLLWLVSGSKMNTASKHENLK